MFNIEKKEWEILRGKGKERREATGNKENSWPSAACFWPASTSFQALFHSRSAGLWRGAWSSLTFLLQGSFVGSWSGTSSMSEEGRLSDNPVSGMAYRLCCSLSPMLPASRARETRRTDALVQAAGRAAGETPTPGTSAGPLEHQH